MILFTFSRFTFWSCDWVSSWLFGSVSFGSAVFSFAEVCSYFTPLEFFTSVLADGFSLEFDWQQVSSSLQDSFQDSGRS